MTQLQIGLSQLEQCWNNRNYVWCGALVIGVHYFTHMFHVLHIINAEVHESTISADALVLCMY